MSPAIREIVVRVLRYGAPLVLKQHGWSGTVELHPEIPSRGQGIIASGLISNGSRVCSCDTNPETTDGASPDCPRHGADDVLAGQQFEVGSIELRRGVGRDDPHVILIRSIDGEQELEGSVIVAIAVTPG